MGSKTIGTLKPKINAYAEITVTKPDGTVKVYRSKDKHITITDRIGQFIKRVKEETEKVKEEQRLKEAKNG